MWFSLILSKEVFAAKNRRFNIEIHSLLCTNYSTLTKQLECGFSKVKHSHYLFFAKFMSNRQFNPDAEVRAQITLRMKGVTQPMKFLDLQIKICDVLSKASSVPIVRNLFDEARRTSNIPYKCPIKRNVLYRMHNYSLTAESIPPYATIFNFTLEMDFYNEHKRFANTIVKGATVPNV
ncbi:uncharacterized protein LOC142239490 [Haematobia irritans]|uniref:uncharacterized protein LOC142239490 n=1 Tax=Haematobia irritans TaxID=7368 RepID=UPI003F509C15